MESAFLVRQAATSCGIFKFTKFYEQDFEMRFRRGFVARLATLPPA
jgi:hypothetical protein